MRRYFVRFSIKKGFFRTKIILTCLINVKNKFNIIEQQHKIGNIYNKYNCKGVRILDSLGPAEIISERILLVLEKNIVQNIHQPFLYLYTRNNYAKLLAKKIKV